MHRRTKSRAPPVRHHSGGDALQSEGSRLVPTMYCTASERKYISLVSSRITERRTSFFSLPRSRSLPSLPSSHVSCALYLLLWLVGGSCRELRYMLKGVFCIANGLVPYILPYNLLVLILVAVKGIDRCDWWHRETCVYSLSVDTFILVLLEVLQKFYRWSVLQRHRI